MKYVIVTGILLCLSAIYYYVAARMLLESEVISVPEVTFDRANGVTPPPVVNATSTWEQVILTTQHLCGTGSTTGTYGIATAGVPLEVHGEASAPTLSFSFVQCESNPVAFSVEGSTIYKIASTTKEKTVIAKFWQLAEENSTESFINDLIKTLPTEQERLWCAVEERVVTATDPWLQLFVPNESVYQVALKDEYYNTTEGIDSTSLCVPYADMFGVTFFKRIGEYLFMIPVGQNLPTFSPASFEIK